MKIDSVPVVKSYSVSSGLRMAKGVKTALNCKVFWFYPFAPFHEHSQTLAKEVYINDLILTSAHMNEATLINLFYI